MNVHVGVANNSSSNVTNNADGAGAGNTWLAAVDYTVGDSAGVLGGTTIYGATIQDLNEADLYYLQVGLPVPVEGLSLDFAADWVDGDNDEDDEIYQVYASYSLSEKATLIARYEWGTIDTAGYATTAESGLDSVAIGLHYAIWDNVTSRVEWMETSADTRTDDETLAINLVYSF